MSFRQEGNGETKTRINFHEGRNHVLICPADAHNLPPDIALILNNALIDWLKLHPGIRVRSVLTITQDGQTTAIHLWYDLVDT
jgi:hypothetical protein